MVAPVIRAAESGGPGYSAGCRIDLIPCAGGPRPPLHAQYLHTASLADALQPYCKAQPYLLCSSRFSQKSQ
jgi:hypothetical protein